MSAPPVARRARTAVVARTRAARHAARAQFLRHRGDQAGAEGVDLCLERLQHACGLRVRLLDAQETAGSHIGQDGGLVRGGGRGAGHRERVAHQHVGRPGASRHVAIGIEADLQFADHLRVFPGLNQANALAVLVLQHGRVGARGRTRAVGRHRVGAQQGVRITAHHHVDAAQVWDDLLVVVVADMAHHHDLRADIRAGRLLRLVGDRQADDADGLAVALQHDGRLDEPGRARRVQRRGGGERDVGAQQRGLARTGMQQVDKALQAAVALVELVVAERHRVKADRVHHGRLGLAGFTGAVEVQRAGVGVARVQFQHVGRLRRQRVEGAGHARKAAHFHVHRHRHWSDDR
ncbi:hypothetical protein G6F65_016594 [Rhizopus arrhizus]|nr:hypothetical protein G6F65_016594 [Rhizopus arrhizus]